MKGWLKQNNWWKGLLVVMVLGLSGVAFMGVRAYQDAPPIPDFVDPEGNEIISGEQVLDGQSVFQKYALMDYGSMFGDGAARGPDYTAEALHQIALAMQAYYRSQTATASLEVAPGELSPENAIEVQVQHELKRNTYDTDTNRVTLTDAQAAAFDALLAYYTEVFAGDHAESIKPRRIITDPIELRDITAFFYWGAWVCAAQRPDQETSYTHNWPYDETAGNTPGPAVLLWSVIGSFALFLALGIVLYMHGRFRDRAGYVGVGNHDQPVHASPEAVTGYRPSPTQRATYKYFAVGAVLFLCQVLVGVLTVHDFVNFTTFFGLEVRDEAPIMMVRSLHIQFALFWISACWIGGSIFILPFLTKVEPRGQKTLVNVLFWMIVVLVAGTTFGIVFGPKGLFGEDWRLFGHQGWEFVELGKVWQALMMACFLLWTVIVFRGVWPAVRAREPWTLPNMLLCVIGAIVLFFSAGFVAGPRTNFVIADFWRWCVIHMWAEAFFEVFTTIVVAYFMVLMGLVSKQAAARIVYLATILFLGSGLLGISHNFYWNAKPVETLAIGSVFSTLQVVPLMLLTLEAWRFRSLPRESLLARDKAEVNGSGAVRNGPLTDRFAHNAAFLFLVGVNFWNFLGAGVFGFIINLPIVNYYEHGTYLTVNHGHAALMGVYGNLSIAAMIFVGRYLIRGDRHNGPLLRVVFWSLNIGLMLMVLLDLFPAGIAQLDVVLNEGFWKARSQAFIEGATFQTFTWMRIIGGAIFTIGGVIPLAVYMVTRLRALKPAGPNIEQADSAEWSGAQRAQQDRQPAADGAES